MTHQPEPIEYASMRDPGQGAASPWPLIILCFLAMALIGLGGCFCIGLLLLVEPRLASQVPVASQRFDEARILLAFLLTLCALACIVPGLLVAITLIRRLLRRI